MKKIIVLLGSTLFAGMLALSGTAYAAGCHYDSEGKHASAPLVEGELPTDPELLAKIKEQEAADAQEALQPGLHPYHQYSSCEAACAVIQILVVTQHSICYAIIGVLLIPYNPR